MKRIQDQQIFFLRSVISLFDIDYLSILTSNVVSRSLVALFRLSHRNCNPNPSNQRKQESVRAGDKVNLEDHQVPIFLPKDGTHPTDSRAGNDSNGARFKRRKFAVEDVLAVSPNL